MIRKTVHKQNYESNGSLKQIKDLLIHLASQLSPLSHFKVTSHTESSVFRSTTLISAFMTQIQLLSRYLRAVCHRSYIALKLTLILESLNCLKFSLGIHKDG